MWAVGGGRWAVQLQTQAYFALVSREPPALPALSLAERDPPLHFRLFERVEEVLGFKGEVGLEDEHDGVPTVLNVGSDLLDVRYEKFVGRPHVAGYKRVDAEHLHYYY